MADHTFHGSRRRASVVGAMFTGLPAQKSAVKRDTLPPALTIFEETQSEDEEEEEPEETVPLAQGEGVPPEPSKPLGSPQSPKSPTKLLSNVKPDGVHLRWHHLSYDVDDGNNGTKRILHGLAGSVSPGDVMAIMGPSGCGKSSLLNILTQRRGGEEEGVFAEIEINGKPVNLGEFSRLSGFVSQDFEFFEFLTVRETLEISATLTLPESWTVQRKHARVDTLLAELDLLGAADTIIGSSFGGTVGGISGGERRRLCVAMELMNDPHLLLLDEPTSGLDSASALMMVSLLKKLAKRGKTIVCVIHQPRASIMPMFNQLLLLGAGRMIYYGPSCNFRKETDPLREFFKEADHACPAFENPADHILDVINTVQGADEEQVEEEEEQGSAEGTVKHGDSLKQRSSAVLALSELYTNTALYTRMMELRSRGEGVPIPAIEGDVDRKYPTSWCTQFRVIFKRTIKLKFRDPMCFGTVVAGIIVMAALHGRCGTRL